MHSVRFPLKYARSMTKLDTPHLGCSLGMFSMFDQVREINELTSAMKHSPLPGRSTAANDRGYHLMPIGYAGFNTQRSLASIRFRYVSNFPIVLATCPIDPTLSTQWILYLGLASVALSDLLMSATLCVLLARRRSNFER